MADQSRQSREQPQPGPAQEQSNRGRNREDIERRIQRQTFNAGERDQADDITDTTEDISADVDFVDDDVQQDVKPIGERRQRPQR